MFKHKAVCIYIIYRLLRTALEIFLQKVDMSSALAPVVRVATCSLNQHALDFAGNYERILASILLAKRRGARYRLGPELEVCGYGCQDHLLESDVFRHSWTCLSRLLAHPTATCGILCDVGMPVLHRGVRYNCRVFLLDRRIVLIRPKLYMANDGNYREHRYFTPWHLDRRNEEHKLPAHVAASTAASVGGGAGDAAAAGAQQKACPFGFYAVEALDGVTVASETCEELFTPQSPHIALALDGIDIISNGSGSHHELSKLATRVNLMQSATQKSGGVYMYANQQGCDGGRLYFDGCSMVFVNGEVVAQGKQFSVADVEVVLADVDIDAVRSFRSAVSSRSSQAAASTPVPRVSAGLKLAGVEVPRCGDGSGPAAGAGASAGSQTTARVMPPPTLPLKGGARYHTPEEEISLGPACWLWDYLRRSGASGFFLPLSGGADSASTCAMMGIMCELVYQAVSGEVVDATVLSDLRRVMGHTLERAEQLRGEISQIEEAMRAEEATGGEAKAGDGGGEARGSGSGSGSGNGNSGDKSILQQRLDKAVALLSSVDVAYVPTSPKEIARRVMHTAYLGTSNSSEETRSRAVRIASQIGTFHINCEIDSIVSGLLQSYEDAVRTLDLSVAGGLGEDMRPKFKSQGGHWMEDLALQNIQARYVVGSFVLSEFRPLSSQNASLTSGCCFMLFYVVGGGGACLFSFLLSFFSFCFVLIF